jgi:hypothetical protein
LDSFQNQTTLKVADELNGGLQKKQDLTGCRVCARFSGKRLPIALPAHYESAKLVGQRSQPTRPLSIIAQHVVLILKTVYKWLIETIDYYYRAPIQLV